MRGAQLYMRLDDDTRSCVSCHGPDPGVNHNNILRAADNPQTLTKVMNTVSAMGFLSSRLTEQDRADVTAFLGSITRLNAPGSTLRVFPVTVDFGSVGIGAVSAPHQVRITNGGAAAVAIAAIESANASVDVRHACPAQLAAGSSCDVTLRLMPLAAGLLRPTLNLRVDSHPGGIQVAGTGKGVVEPVSSLAWGQAAPVVAFSSADAASQVQTIRLVNPGPVPAVLGLTSIVGPAAASFRIESGCASGTTLAAGTGCDLQVVYLASALATVQASLQIRSDQGNPSGLRLEGVQSSPPPAAEVAPQGGGGCSTGPARPPPGDPVLPGAVILALALLLRRAKRSGDS